MSIIQGAVRARAPESPISIVFSGLVGDRTDQGTWNMVLPDPGSLLVNDVVISNLSVNNGAFNGTDPTDNGWTQVGGVTEVGNSRNYANRTYARRVTSAGSLTTTERTYSFFTNFINSNTAASIIVLRGVRNSGGGVGLDLSGIANATISFPDPPAAVRPEPLSVARGGAGRLAFSFGSLNVTGTVGPAPSGWTRLFLQTYIGLAGSAQAYCDVRWFPTDGTTIQVAPDPTPTVDGYALVHAIAP